MIYLIALIVYGNNHWIKKYMKLSALMTAARIIRVNG